MTSRRGVSPSANETSVSKTRALSAVPAATALLAGLILVPWAMFAWRHNPLPTSFEPLRWVQLAADGYVHPDVVPDALAIAIWVVWAQFLFAVVRETTARLVRGVAAAPSAFVIPPVQRLACNLVAAISIVMVSHPAGAAVPSLASLTTSALATSPAAALSDAATDEQPSRDARTAEYVCDRFDTLRSLAGTFYGNPDEWTRIRDASVGQVQDDGSRLTPGFVAVSEGTRLLVPADDLRAELTSATTSPDDEKDGHSLVPDADDHTVRAGDVLWRIAETSYPRARPSDIPQIVDAIFKANEGASDGNGRSLRDPDVINPGMRLSLPSLGAKPGAVEPAPPTVAPVEVSPKVLSPEAPPIPATSTATAPASPTPSSSSATTGGSTADAASQSSPDRSSASVAWLAGGGAGLLATGFLALWSYRRRRRDAQVMPGQKLPTPDPALLSMHAGIRVAADPTGPVRIDAALRSLAWLHRVDLVHVGPVVQVLLRQPDGDIDVFLREPVEALSKPWEPTSDGRIWHLAAGGELLLETGATEIPDPNPALVQLGTTPDGADAVAELYVDLEALGVLALEDETAPKSRSARSIARALTATLATSPLAGIPRIRTSGFDPYGLVSEERLHDHLAVEELIEATALDAQGIQHQLQDHDAETTIDLRVRYPKEPADPTVVVVVDTDLAAADAERLAGIAGGGSQGVALVLPARCAPDATWRLVHTGIESDGHASIEGARRPQWRLDPLGISVDPVALAAEELAALSALLEEAIAPALTAARPSPDPIPAAPSNADSVSRPVIDQAQTNGHVPEAVVPGVQPVKVSPVARTFTPPAWKVMVRLLGTIDLVGVNGDAPAQIRDRTVETLAWLVLHPNGTRAQMESALWPTGARSSTISNTLSRARLALEELAGPEAHSWIPGYQNELRVDAAVTTDLAVLQAHVDWATRHRDHPVEAIAVLREGLALVRGVPEGYPWLDAEHGSALTVSVTTAAILLATLCLEEGDTEGTLQASTAGLAILPAHPELFGLRMRARVHEGDRTGARAEYEAYLRAESADPMADGETDRDLERLFTQLVQR